MHKYDVTLKNALRRLTGSVLRDVSGVKVTRWHNNELPSVHTRRADMLGEAADGQLLDIELQSTNQADMALRMLEYATAIHRQFGRLPRQLVLYVGAARLRMGAQIRGEHLNYRCRIVDLRSLDVARRGALDRQPSGGGQCNFHTCEAGRRKGVRPAHFTEDRTLRSDSAG